MYQALYRKWRPQSFADVVGQSAICDTLTKQVETGKTSHAYLFSGSRGTGKTTCAKILAKAVNCENPFHGNPCNKCPTCLGITSGEVLDIVEIDAASNNGVDYVRELRDEAVYSPANAKKRVYIIDEVHMFSSSAFNALLKIMEEPPEHVVFILATTELHKVPATVASRCQRFIFKRVPVSVIADRMMFIARSEGATLSEDAASYIASLADGAMRDALSLLDQCISVGGGNVTAETVENVVGYAGRLETLSLARALSERDLKGALVSLNEIYTGGKNITSVLNEIAAIFRDVLILKADDGTNIARVSARYTEGELNSLADKFDNVRLCSAIEALQNATGAIAASPNKRIDAELCCVRICESAGVMDCDALISRISELERKLQGSVVTVKPTEKKTEEKKPEPQNKEEPETEKTPAKKVEKPVKEETCAGGDAIWQKILAAAESKLSPGVTPLFKSVKAELSGHILSLSSENAFVLQMLTRAENMDTLRAVANDVADGIALTVGRQANKEKKQETSGLDELLSGLEGMEGLTIK
ncbi:MAG: DNA polymerase III subunit gamma/tau [Oscillospiraceae bacterium]|nr:DNA polymerase III subunit gamma/tau [Oscillospiraceae bacterium]